jgi:hypothetical protein
MAIASLVMGQFLPATPLGEGAVVVSEDAGRQNSNNGDDHVVNGGSGELRSGPIAGTTYLAGTTFARKPVLYAEVDGMAIFEGDIILGRVEDLRRTADGTGDVQQAVVITGQQFRWPNGRVAYEIDPALPNPQRVTDAVAHWEANTNLRFVARTPANAAQWPDFVRFVDGGGCSSAVGRQGGMQITTLGSGCGTGNAIHEIGHVIGLWHEQSREDRDSFVTIVWANIDPAMQHNFTQHISDGDDIGPYDYGSIMHYPPTAFSINGQATIVPLQPLPPGVVMGQRNGLSAGDIAAANQLYPAHVTIKELAKDPIQDTVKELAKDPIRDTTVKELVKDPIRDTTVKELVKDPIRDTTVKELAKDPIRDATVKEGALDPGPGPDPGPLLGMPFVLATPPQAPGLAGQQDAATQLAHVVQQLGDALAAVEQDRAGLATQYDAAVNELRRLLGEQGG